MGAASTIEWTDATWNPVTGCAKISPGCKFCYAERLAVRLQRMGNPRYQNGFAVTLHHDQVELPLRWRAPRRIFVNSMSDLFHDEVPLAFVDRVFDVMRRADHHVFQLLTKRPGRLVEWWRTRADARRIPGHIWLGVSVESIAYAWRVDRLREIDVDVRFISAEPLLGSLAGLNLRGIAWVISGGESGGPAARRLVEPCPCRGRGWLHDEAGRPGDTVACAACHHGWRPKAVATDWIRELRDAAVAAGAAYFHKQWGGRTPTSSGRTVDDREWSEYPVIRTTIATPSTVIG